jgi:hypothetical protein
MRRWSARALREEAERLGMAEIAVFLTECEIECERRWAVRSYMGTAHLYALTGKWFIPGGGHRQYPDEPPEGLSPRQRQIVARRIRQGFTVKPNALAPIDWRRAAKLQGKTVR